MQFSHFRGRFEAGQCHGNSCGSHPGRGHELNDSYTLMFAMILQALSMSGPFALVVCRTLAANVHVTHGVAIFTHVRGHACAIAVQP